MGGGGALSQHSKLKDGDGEHSENVRHLKLN